jgi:diguanylate cyclase (GGDEF)-like protein/PAS domain S-box-containing protein
MFQQLSYRLVFCLFLTASSLAAGVSLTEQERQFLARHPVITLGSDSNWAPFILRDQNGSISGYDAEILQRINDLTGANFQLTSGSWQNMVEQATIRDIDGLSTSAVHESRGELFNFSAPYTTQYQHLMVSYNNPKNIRNLENLSDIRIGYQAHNLATQKAIEQLPGVIGIPFSSAQALSDALLSEQIDALVGNHSALLSANRIHGTGLTIIETIQNSAIDLVFSVRKDYPEAISILNKALAEIPKEDREQIYHKWFFYSAALPATQNGLKLNTQEHHWLLNHSTWHVMAPRDLPPFSYQEDGQQKGYYIDYLNLLANKVGADIEFEFIKSNSWKKGLTMLSSGQVDIIPQLTKSEDRQSDIAYSNFKIIHFKTGFAVKKTENNIHIMDNLDGKVLAVTEGSYLHQVIKKKYPDQTLYLADSIPDLLQAVVNGQADAVYGVLPILEYHIQKNWLSNLKTIEAADNPTPMISHLQLAVKKDNSTLLSILEKTQGAITNAEDSELKSRWMNIKPGIGQLALTKEEQNYLDEKRQISMCIDPDWMPFEKNDNGKHIGMSADYFELFESQINIPINVIKTHNWLESIELGKSRQCDIFSLLMETPERSDYLLFTTPYITAPLVIVTDISEPFIDNISQIKDKKIGTVQGYAYTALIKNKYPEINLIEVATEVEGLEKVYQGELYGFIGTLPTSGYQIQRRFVGELKITGKFDEQWHLGVAVRNDEPLLQSIFNKAIASISTQEHQSILNKWVSVRYHQASDYRQVFYSSLIFILIILVFAYQNRSIRKINKKLEKANIDIEEQQAMVNRYVLILETDSQGKITYANEAFCRTTGFQLNELVDLAHSEIIHHDASDKMLQDVAQRENRQDHWAGEAFTMSKNKKKINFNTYINAIYKDGKKVGYRTILVDITDKKHIEELSIKDHLTGLFNRKKLEEIAAEQISTYERYQVSFSIILIDIDDFKLINDTYGHDIGDTVLERLSSILKIKSRATDYVGRWGGEEFLIICPHSSGAQTLILADNLRNHVHQVSFDKVGRISFSAGVTEFSNGDTFATAFKRSDNALYQAKTTGKNKTVLS